MKPVKFLKPGMTIGVMAPSLGCPIDPYAIRYEHGIANIKKRGYQVVETASVHEIEHARSASAAQRVKEFEQLWYDDSIDFIWSVGGGEFMCEMLPLIDFEKIGKSQPKLYMGYSDNTCLTFTLTTMFDFPTIYGYHPSDFCPSRWSDSLKETYSFITGATDTVVSKHAYESLKDKGDPAYLLRNCKARTKNEWKSLSGHAESFEGRIVGGCLDVIMMLPGTPYDHFKEYAERHQEEGVILYFESYDLNIFSQGRAYWQLKEAGWFKHCKGILLGRGLNQEEFFGVTYEETLHDFLDDLQIPVLYDVDLGHLPPTVPILNGSIAKVNYADGQGTIVMHKEDME